eukprot:6544400-Prymnesium_polylepis.1
MNFPRPPPSVLSSPVTALTGIRHSSQLASGQARPIARSFPRELALQAGRPEAPAAEAARRRRKQG